MSQKITASMPANTDAGPAFTFRVTALDPSTGALVSGVKIGKVAIEARALGVGSLETGAWRLVPGPGA